jgi:DNA-binding NarL/FixJ family response regulator
MLNADWYVPLFYALIGALVLFCAFRVRQYAQQRSRRKDFKFTGVRLVDKVAVSPTRQREWLWEKLTPREMQVAQLIAEGKRNAEIAQALSISVRTVQTHLQNIYAKLEVHSRTELVRVIRDLVD